jgi:hypothetical protein
MDNFGPPILLEDMLRFEHKSYVTFLTFGGSTKVVTDGGKTILTYGQINLHTWHHT